MKKVLLKSILFILLFISLISITSCKKKDSITTKGDYMDKTLELVINDKIIDVTWLDNESINDLKAHINDSLIVSMHKYGGFEQVGSIGFKVKNNDTKITTNPGDIVLYSSNQIVLFYGSNSWSYTKLGHINMSNEELEELLGNDDINITLNLK